MRSGRVPRVTAACLFCPEKNFSEVRRAYLYIPPPTPQPHPLTAVVFRETGPCVIHFRRFSTVHLTRRARRTAPTLLSGRKPKEFRFFFLFVLLLRSRRFSGKRVFIFFHIIIFFFAFFIADPQRRCAYVVRRLL